jgi:hypothetical protein
MKRALRSFAGCVVTFAAWALIGFVFIALLIGGPR